MLSKLHQSQAESPKNKFENDDFSSRAFRVFNCMIFYFDGILYFPFIRDYFSMFSLRLHERSLIGRHKLLIYTTIFFVFIFIYKQKKL